MNIFGHEYIYIYGYEYILYIFIHVYIYLYTFLYEKFFTEYYIHTSDLIYCLIF